MNLHFTTTVYLFRRHLAPTPTPTDYEPIEVLIEARYEQGAIQQLEVFLGDANITDQCGPSLCDHLADRALYRAMRHA